MKKFLALGVIAIALICIHSCSKKTSYTNYFTFQGATYPVTLSSRAATVTTASVTFASSSTNETGTITCVFDSIIPPSSGSYHIVGGLVPSTVNQMALQLTIGPNTYIATGNDNISANVTVSSSGKLSVSIPPVWVASTPGDTLWATPVDSTKLSATISE